MSLGLGLADVPSQLNSGVHFWSKYQGRNVCFPYIRYPMMSVCPFLVMLTLWFFKSIHLFLAGSSLLRTGSLWLPRVGAALHCGALACHRGGVACGSQALRHTASSSGGARVHLLHGTWDLPRPRIEIRVPGTGRWIAIHCATREIPGAVLTQAP